MNPHNPFIQSGYINDLDPTGGRKVGMHLTTNSHGKHRVRDIRDYVWFSL
ncbi:MAG TPA: hypothetical protein VKD91_08740 [Pyrinomonadaceae bacterium]|nr:hypothetical protein [Pyrinomonadaceae bacterium]